MTDVFSEETLRAYEALEYGYEPFVKPETQSRQPTIVNDITEDDVLSMAWSKVYLARSGSFVKIGRTMNIIGRLRVLRSYNPHPVNLVAILLGGHELETALHRRFADLRHQDEWFRWHRKIALWVRSGCSMRYVDHKAAGRYRAMVGLDGIEPSTFRMSSERSPAEL